MPPIPALTDDDRAAFSHYPNLGVGTVVGVHPRTGDTCDVEVLLIFRRRRDFVVRHLTLELDELAAARETLFDMDPAPIWEHTDTSVRTLDDALRVATESAAVSTALPIPGLRHWRSTQAVPPFGGTLTRYELRSAVPSLTSPTRTQTIARRVGSFVFFTIFVLLFILLAGIEVFDPWGDKDLTVPEVFLGGLLVAAAVGAIGFTASGVEWLRARRASRRTARAATDRSH